MQVDDQVAGSRQQVQRVHWERSERQRILQAHSLRTKLTTAAVLNGKLPPRSTASVVMLVLWSVAIAAIAAAAVLAGVWIAGWMGAKSQSAPQVGTKYVLVDALSPEQHGNQPQ